MNRWYWRAVYNDGTGISQLEKNPATGLEWSSDHVDLTKLTAMVLEPKDGKSPRVIMQIKEGETPRRFWRQYVSATGPSVGNQKTCWCLVLEKAGVTFCNFFRPDGSVVISTDVNNGSEFQVPLP